MSKCKLNLTQVKIHYYLHLSARGIHKVMHSKALLVQDFTNLVYIWHKHDRTHLFAIIIICFSFIFRILKLKLDLEMAAPLEARQSCNQIKEL